MRYTHSVNIIVLSLCFALFSQITMANDKKTTSEAKPSFEQYIIKLKQEAIAKGYDCLLYTSPSPRD